jgi:hypothetical protein
MATYLEIVNRALREINEVPLTEGAFDTARGLQQFTKDATNRAYFDIANESVEWPWLHNTITRVEGTEVLEVSQGIQWYDKALTELEVDWHTFYITDKDPRVVSSTPPEISRSLEYITYDQWARTYRDKDNQRVDETQAEPRRVVRHPNGKIGISPVPDQDLFIEYFVWKSATSFALSTDVIPFPEEFENVFLHRIRYYIWLFRENVEQAQMAKSDYKESLASMKRILLSNKSERMRAV